MDNNSVNIKYVSMDDYEYNWYFYDEEIRVPRDDIISIKPLSLEYSGLLWEQYVSNHKEHYMLLDSQNKLLISEQEKYNWDDDWNNGTYENFQNYLIETVLYKLSDTIIIFWSKNYSVETKWSIFTKHWANFLFDDEGVVLVNITNKKVLVFCPSGVLLKGESTFNAE